MAVSVIEEYFPKTADYINSVFDDQGRERGGHHNYVIEQKCCNFSQKYGDTIVNSDAETLAAADDNFLAYLKHLDNAQ